MLRLRTDGKLELQSSANREAAVCLKSPISKMRWTHVTLVHYPHRASNPSIRAYLLTCVLFLETHWVYLGLFLDGVLQDAFHWIYPTSESLAQTITYTVGDDSATANMSICVASSYMIAVPIGDYYSPNSPSHTFSIELFSPQATTFPD